MTPRPCWWLPGRADGPDSSDDDEEDEEDEEKATFTSHARNSLDAYVKSMGRVRILAKPPLLEKIQQVHIVVQRLVKHDAKRESFKQAAQDLTSAVSDFEVAAKEELGIK